MQEEFMQHSNIHLYINNLHTKWLIMLEIEFQRLKGCKILMKRLSCVQRQIQDASFIKSLLVQKFHKGLGTSQMDCRWGPFCLPAQSLAGNLKKFMQFKLFCLPLKTSCRTAENVNETLEWVVYIFCSY